MQITEWISIYVAVINTAALGVAALLYAAWVKQKSAQIENRQTQIEHWKTQSVIAVHEANEALRKEIEELRKKADMEREQLEREKAALLKTISDMKAQREAPTQRFWQELENGVQKNFNWLIGVPPSGIAADRLVSLSTLLGSGSSLLSPEFPKKESEKDTK